MSTERPEPFATNKEKGRARSFNRVRDPVCPRSCPYGKYVKLLLFLQSPLENVPCFNAPEDEPSDYFAQ
jgi:hypothetical protein